MAGYPWNGYPPCAQRSAEPIWHETLRAAVYFFPGSVADEDQGLRALAPHPQPYQKKNILAAMRILTYWTLSKNYI